MAGNNCVICGYYSTRPFCIACEEKAQRYFEIICNYLKSKPRPSLIDVYGDTFVPLPVIYGFKELGWVDIVPANGEVYVAPAGEHFNTKVKEYRRAW